MKSTNSADYQRTKRPIAGMPKDLTHGSFIEPHRHRRAQLVWATEGVMTVTAAEAAWIVPPQRALWIPAGIVHSIRMSGTVAMRTLYIEPDAAHALPKDCKIVLMTGLLRELVLEAVRAPLDEDRNGRMSHVEALILDEIGTLSAETLSLPMPRDRRLRTICEALLNEPGRQETLEQWSDKAGASSRTLARLFAGETGMRFVDWRRQARLAAALVRLVEGERRGFGRARSRLRQRQRVYGDVQTEPGQGAARLFR